MPKTNPCPCEYCVPPKRKPGCHGSCPDYAEWNQEHVSKKEKMQYEKLKQGIVADYVIKITNRNRRKKNLDQAKRK